MWRSLWQTPAAFTLINTCVPDGCGVASSNSCSGALKSATLKLFIGVLPDSFLVAATMAWAAGRDKLGPVWFGLTDDGKLATRTAALLAAAGIRQTSRETCPQP